MLVRMSFEILEPVVSNRITPEDVSRMLRRALNKKIELNFSPIELKKLNFRARGFPNGYRNVSALVGKASAMAEVDIREIMPVLEPKGLSYFSKACHRSKRILNALVKSGQIRRYTIPCELANFALGKILPPGLSREVRLWRDQHGYWHVFGLVRLSIRLRI